MKNRFKLFDPVQAGRYREKEEQTNKDLVDSKTDEESWQNHSFL